MIELEVNGERYERFDEASVQMALDRIARGFTFGAASAEGKPLPFEGGDACSVYVDDTKVLTGFIEVIDVISDGNSHGIKISGRSSTGDIVDSSINAIEFAASVSLQTIIRRVIDFLEFEGQVLNEVPGLEDFNLVSDKIGPKVGENAFVFIERLARMRQVLLTCDEDSNIIITRAIPEFIDVVLQNVIDGDSNNIISSTVSYDNTDRFRQYSVKSQMNVSALFGSGTVDLANIVNQGPDEGEPLTEDTAVRKGRKMVFKAEKASTSETNKKRAVWEANIRRTRSQTYTVVVSGHQTADGDLWETNKLLRVKDDFAGIDATMLINSVEFSSNLSEGNTTTLEIVIAESYLVDISEPPPTNKVATGLFGSAS